MTTLCAIFSDIHGNLAALEAFADALDRNPVDRVFCLGDLVAMGPDPAACLDLLNDRIRPEIVIRGNTDRYLSERIFNKPGGDPEFLAMFRWAFSKLSGPGRRYLDGLPYERVVTVEEVPILLCHGAPGDDELGLTPELETARLEGWLKREQARVIVGGHTHIPCTIEVDDGLVVNDGSIGYPFDADQRSCYLELLIDQWKIVDYRFRRIEYDVQRTIDRLNEVQLPWRQTLIQRLRNARS